MTAKGGTGKMNVKGFTAEEVIPEGALMNCLTVMTDPVEAGDEELTVIPRVLLAREYQRLVSNC
jgi:hypothetical protein